MSWISLHSEKKKMCFTLMPQHLQKLVTDRLQLSVTAAQLPQHPLWYVAAHRQIRFTLTWSQKSVPSRSCIAKSRFRAKFGWVGGSSELNLFLAKWVAPPNYLFIFSPRESIVGAGERCAGVCRTQMSVGRSVSSLCRASDGFQKYICGWDCSDSR